MAIKSPPALVALDAVTGADMTAYQRYSRITDEKGRYLPFDEFRHRVATHENVALAWALTRRARDTAIQRIDYHNARGEQAGFTLTPVLAAACERVDKYATRLALSDVINRLRGAGAALIQLELDESITSSQLEGANTTTLVARSMLESGRTPRTEDEQMIAGNARLMEALPALLDQPLTPALICRFHAIGMQGICDEKYQPGEFRRTDDIAIADYDGNIVHQPPAAEGLVERLQQVCEWANDETHYIHPLVKACILHFILAHEHPFRDGNGRTSRALFYWFMLKSGYEAFRYISISHFLHAAPIKYAHSYQYTETDGMDMTYFLEYQADVIRRGLERLLQHVNELVARAASIDRILFESGALARLTPRQVILLNIMLATPARLYAAADVSHALGTSDNTARSDLRALVREALAEEMPANDQKKVYRIAKKFN